MKGIYVLIVQVSKPVALTIGALGEVTFKAGFYAYVGSAQNNLELRLARHQRRDKRLFWHIDYLLDNPKVSVVDVFYKSGGKSEECKMAGMLEKNGGKPIKGFGCSDCHCKSHLFNGEVFQFLQTQMQLLK